MRQFEKYRFEDNVTLFNADTFNAIWGDLDLRLADVEALRPDLENALNDLLAVGLQKVDEVLTPLVSRLHQTAETGFLIAESTSNVTLTVGEIAGVTIQDELQRQNFTPTPFLAISSNTEPQRYATLRLTAFNRETGVVTFEVLVAHDVAGDVPAITDDDWTVSCSSAIPLTILQVYQTVATAAAVSASSATDASNSATEAEAAAAGAVNAFDEFQEIWLGAQAADPTVDLDGDPLTEGQLYWNTAAKEVRVYDGAAFQVAYNPSLGAVDSVFGRTGAVIAQAGDYTADQITDFDTKVRTSSVDLMASPAGNLSMNSHKIVDLADPLFDQDAATKNYVDDAINALINAAPGALNTLDELAAALGDDANFAASMTTALAGKVPTTRQVTASGLLTGGGSLSGDIAITATEASQAEAQAGTNATKFMTPRRTKEAIDALSSALPVGSLIDWPTFLTAPSALQWKRPDASVLSQSSYPALYALIGTRFRSYNVSVALSGTTGGNEVRRYSEVNGRLYAHAGSGTASLYELTGGGFTTITARTMPSTGWGSTRGMTYGSNGSGTWYVISHYTSTVGQQIAYSTDGNTFTAMPTTALPGTTEPWDIAFGAGLFVAVGDNGSTSARVVTAANPTAAANWTQRTVAGGPLNRVVFASSKFVAVGETKNVRYSTDGITWTAATLPTITNYGGSSYSPNVVDVIYSSRLSKWFALFCDDSGDTASAGVLYSTDGIIWSLGANNVFSDPYKAALEHINSNSRIFDDGTNIIVTGQYLLWASNDGVTFVPTKKSGTSSSWGGGGEYYHASTSRLYTTTGSIAVAYSSDCNLATEFQLPFITEHVIDGSTTGAYEENSGITRRYMKVA